MTAERRRGQGGRKKPNKSSRPRMVAHGARHTFQAEQFPGPRDPRSFSELTAGQRADLLAGLSRLAGDRDELEARRAPLADAAARQLAADLLALPIDLDTDAFEDAVCTLLGERTHALEHVEDIDDYLNPETVLGALIDAAAHAARQDPAAVRLLAALADIAPGPLHDTAQHAIRDLDSQPHAATGGFRPRDPAPAGTAQWIRDDYGTRFGVIAPFAAHGDTGMHRWYLWDIDACGLEPVTVYAGYFADPTQALTAWHDGVGPTATAHSALTTVQDLGLLRELLPKPPEFSRIGGEDPAQMGEYHRSRRLAERILADLDHEPPATPRQTAGLRELTAEAWAEQFRGWRATHRPVAESGPDTDEAISVLADEWSHHGPAQLGEACSPHRLTLIDRLLRDLYQDEFAILLTGLLPDWAAWLCERAGVTPDLAERSRNYASAWTHPAPEPDGRGYEPMARVIEA
jgi:hypothetical protein